MNSKKIETAVRSWIANLTHYKQNGGLPARGTLGGALVVLERLKSRYVLEISAHTAPGGTQLSGLSGAKVKKLLATLGEHRDFGSEVGRTNRGSRDEVAMLLGALQPLRLETLTEAERSSLLKTAQEYVGQVIAEWFNRQRLEFAFEPTASTRNTISTLLDAARTAGKEGPVAQHLVGAKLAMRFPKLVFSNQSASTADVQTQRDGDFRLGDMPIHVTVAPMQGVYDKCARNIGNGLRPLLLVPDRHLTTARGNAELMGLRGLAVESVETYVALNCDELTAGTRDLQPAQLRTLLEIYNGRVNEVEADKSLLIELPPLIAKAKRHAES